MTAHAPLIDASEIRRLVGPAAFRRAQEYVRTNAVLGTRWDAATSTLSSDVAGNDVEPYHCAIRIDARPGIRSVVSARCSCPVGSNCKHVAATLVESNVTAAFHSMNPDAEEEAPEPETRPPWRSSLDRLLEAERRADAAPIALGFELRQRETRSRGRWGSTKSQTATPAALAKRTDGVSLGIRPLVRSASGNWVKGNLSWSTLGYQVNRLSLDPLHLAWARQLASLASATRVGERLHFDGDWIVLDDFDSALLWPLLSEAERLGIRLVETKKSLAVAVGESAEVGFRAENADDGGLVLTPEVRIDGRALPPERTGTIGSHGLYSFELTGADAVRVTIAPAEIAPAALRLLAKPEPMDVPAPDADDFLREHLPRLVRRVPVTAGEGVELPVARPPELVLTARYAEKNVLSLSWDWDYPDLGRRPYGSSAKPPDDELRDDALEARLRASAEATWARVALPPFSASLTLRGVEAAEFSEHALDELAAQDGVRVDVVGVRPDYRELVETPELTVSTVESADADWFELGVVVSIEGRTIPFVDLFTALAKRQKKLLLVDNSYFSLSHPSLDRLRDLIEEAAVMNEWEPDAPRISRYQTDLWDEFEDLADQSVEAVSWRETVAGLKEGGEIEPVPVPAGVRATLRPYQLEGFRWIAFLWRHRLGGILADDMGLGKTLQTLAFLAHAKDSGERRPFLVVAPTSVLSTWRDEAARFTPDLDVRVISATRRKSGTSIEEAAAGADVVITSYTLLRLDERLYQQVEWAGLILDEAQFVKNRKAKAHLAARDLTAPFRLAVTGTPLENDLMELWSLLSLAAPGLFPSSRRFSEEYRKPIELGAVPENQDGGVYRAERLARLRRRIRPLMMRRTKELVAAELPPKQEQELRIDLNPRHRRLYDTIMQRERQKVLGLLDDLDRNRFIVFRSLTLLRMLSLDPALVDEEHADVPSSKLDALFEQLDDAIAEGHRILVFSQFTSFLGTVAARLEDAGVPFAYLDGSTRDRDGTIARFREGDAPVFLISLKAGGFGLTLTEADYVFLLDPWWNPASEAQAVDRTHRIGQTRSVMVYRLIANGTIEEKVMALQRKKARLFTAVMDDDALFSQALTADDIRGLFEG